MTVLKRDGMGPLSPEFAEACRRVADDAPSKRGYHPLPPSTTPAEFREALEVIGIDDEHFAKALNLNVGSAKNILSDPARRYTSKHAEKLRPIVEAVKNDTYKAAEKALSDAEAHELNETHAAARAELDRAIEVERTANLLIGDVDADTWLDEIPHEFALRVLVEGFDALGSRRRDTLLSTLFSFLRAEDKPDAARIADVMEPFFEDEPLPRNVLPDDLMALVARDTPERSETGHFIDLNQLQAVINEYCGFSE